MDYQAEAQLTKSDQFHGELISYSSFVILLKDCINQLNDLDKVKKALFYGKESEMFGPKSPGSFTLENICDAFNSKQGVDLIHCIIGKATEAGELLELLLNTIGSNKFDPVNFKEEIADGQWYDAIGLEAVGSTFAEVQATNIEKLRKRFPNRFTEYDANNRDLFAEREILEKPSATISHHQV